MRISEDRNSKPRKAVWASQPRLLLIPAKSCSHIGFQALPSPAKPSKPLKGWHRAGLCRAGPEERRPRKPRETRGCRLLANSGYLLSAVCGFLVGTGHAVVSLRTLPEGSMVWNSNKSQQNGAWCLQQPCSAARSHQ